MIPADWYTIRHVCVFPIKIFLSLSFSYPPSTGRPAILTIYENGQEKERVELVKLQTRKEMHQLLNDKGFPRKNKGEVGGGGTGTNGNEDEKAEEQQGLTEQERRARMMRNDPMKLKRGRRKLVLLAMVTMVGVVLLVFRGTKTSQYIRSSTLRNNNKNKSSGSRDPGAAVAIAAARDGAASGAKAGRSGGGGGGISTPGGSGVTEATRRAVMSSV
jgi:hypothetical protein